MAFLSPIYGLRLARLLRVPQHCRARGKLSVSERRKRAREKEPLQFPSRLVRSFPSWQASTEKTERDSLQSKSQQLKIIGEVFKTTETMLHYQI